MAAEGAGGGRGRGRRRAGRRMRHRDWRVTVWQLVILVALHRLAWQWLTGIKAISKTPGLYWIDPFFISRPSLIAERFAVPGVGQGAADDLADGPVHRPIDAGAVSSWASPPASWPASCSAATTGSPALLEPYIIAFNSLPRIALVPLITMIFGFALFLAKIMLPWTIVFFIVFFNTFQGARSVDADLIHSARFLGGGGGSDHADKW